MKGNPGLRLGAVTLLIGLLVMAFGITTFAQTTFVTYSAGKYQAI